MNGKLKKICMLALTLAMVLGFGSEAFAKKADGSCLTWYGESEGFGLEAGSQYSDTDMFSQFKSVMPGDVLTQEIALENKSKDSDYIEVYLRAEAVDEEFGSVDMVDFLKQLNMRVYGDGNLIYEASPSEPSNLSEDTLVVTLEAGQKQNLTVELDVPITLGNDCANALGEVDWTFSVEEFSTPKEEKLIQTGQMNLPIMVLVGTGVAIMLYGIVNILKDKRKENV